METRSFSRAGIVLVLKRAVNSARASFSRESSGKRRKWVTLGWMAVLAMPALGGSGFQMQRSLALPGTLSAEIGGGGAAPPTCPPACGIGGILFTVDSTGDGGDVAIGNGICADSHGNCTLRAAIQEANAQPTDDTINFEIPAGSVINLTSALPDLSTNLNIQGPGANLLTVKRDFTAPTEFRIFNVTTSGAVTLSGLTISDGISIDGGGISNATGTVNVTNCTLSGNHAPNRNGISSGAELLTPGS
jgi:CSLREA domain-containing protein